MNSIKIKKIIPLIMILVFIFLVIDFFSSPDDLINAEYLYGDYYDINDDNEMLSMTGSKSMTDTYREISLLVENVTKESIKSDKITDKYKNNIKSKKLFNKLNYQSYLNEIKLNDGDRVIGMINNDFYPPEGQPNPVLIKHINIKDYKKSMLLRLPVCKFKDVTNDQATVVVESDVRLILNKKN